MSGSVALPLIVGPIVGVAVLMEAVTICIAVGCCIYLRRSTVPDRERPFAGQASKSYTRDRDNDDGEDGSKTIRVVHNSLYQSMRSDDGNMSAVKTEYSHGQEAHAFDFPGEPNARVEEELVQTKLRTRTQSSHAYEPINLPPNCDGVSDQPEVNGVEITSRGP